MIRQEMLSVVPHRMPVLAGPDVVDYTSLAALSSSTSSG